MAQSFTALGKGNGFPFCLTKINISNKILVNPPSLAETMNAYWNFDSVSWGGASFNPDNEPKDLICGSPSLNLGSGNAGDSSPNQGGKFTVKNALPTFFYFNGVKYYKHGISMRFEARTLVEDSSAGERSKGSAIIVNYFSSLYTEAEDLTPYTCIDETFQGVVVGKSASERTQSISSVTISGIPFIKEVIKLFGGVAFRDSDPDDPIPPCPTSDGYPGDPGFPTLNLHTY